MKIINKTLNYAGLKTDIFWDVTPYVLVDMYKRLGENYVPAKCSKVASTWYTLFEVSTFHISGTRDSSDSRELRAR
jgi:hypothetical protein